MKRLFAIILATSMALGMAAQAFTLPLPESINNWLWEKQSDSVAGTVYYVDSAAGNDANNGTSETTAWATLDKVNSTVFKPGDKILFKSGATFIGQLMPQGSGNEQEGPICIDKYGGDTLPIINSKGTGENFGAVISLLNQEYWEISNLELTAPSNGESARRVGVRVAAKDYGTVDHVYVTNCYIHDIACDIAKSPSGAQSEAGGDLWYGAGGGGISFLTVEGGDSIPSAFNDILVDNNIVKQVGRSGTGISISTANNNIYQQGYSFENDNADWFPNTNILISNNDVSYTSTAIFLSGCDGDIANGVTIENNLVYHPDNYDSNSGVWFALCNGINVQYNEVYALDNGGTNDCGAFDYDGGITNSIMQYNYTHHNRGEAVMVCNIHWSSAWEYNNTSDNIYRYNISENDLWGANKGHGRFWVQAGSQRSWFYNNVVYIADGLPGNNIAVTGDSQDTYIYNNLFINLSDKTTWYVKDTATLYMDYNAYYGYAPTGDNWLPDNIKNYNDYYGTTVTSSFLGGENSVYMGLDDPLPIVGNEYIGKKIYTGKNKKDETGLRPTDYGMDIDTYLGGFKLNTEADWSDFGGKNPLIDAGKKIEHKNREGIKFGMGGKDFYENAVSKDEIPDIGAHETGSKGVDKTAPKMGNVTATATDFDEIKLTWSAAEDNVGISHYVIYVDQKAIGRVYATEGNNGSYTYTVNKLIGSTGPLVDYLLADTEYEIFVRAIDYTSNYDDSTVNTVKTESASAMESTLIISESSTWGCGSKKYDFNSNVKQSEFKSGDFVAPRYKITDKNGNPVEDVWVSILVEAEGQENNDVWGMLTDKNGIAQPGFYAETYVGDNVPLNISVRTVEKCGYTYNSADNTDKSLLTVNVAGYDGSIYGNTVKNGGFDYYYPWNLTPISWTVNTDNGIDAVNVSAKSSFDGGNALKISADSTYNATVTQKITGLTPGIYTFTMYVKNTAPGAIVSVGNEVSNISVTDEWIQMVVEDVTVSGTSTNISIEVTGTPDSYTMIDKVELSQNILKNSQFKNVTTKYNLPSDWYYVTESGIHNTRGEDTADISNDVSLGAIKPLFHYGSSSVNALKFQSEGAFNTTIGQKVTNIPNGVYTFVMTTLSTGGLEGSVTVSGYGGAPVTTKIGLSSGEKITKIAGIDITTGTATVEINIKGSGSADDYIIVQSPSLSARSDFPSTSKRVIFAGDNLLESINPSFEDDGQVTEGIPQGWERGWTAGSAITTASDEEAHTGKYSMKVEFPSDGSTVTGAVTISPVFSFSDLPNGYYTLGCWVKGKFAAKFTATANGNEGYEVYSTIKDEWHYISIKNIKITDGRFSFGFWCDPDFYETVWCYIDDVEFYMQENLLDNSGFESNVTKYWSTTDNEGYAKVKNTTNANEGSNAARIVLPGTPSTVKLISKSTLTNMLPGTYTFKAMVKGSSELEMFAVADGGAITKSVKAAADVDEWKAVSLTIKIDDSFKELGIRAVNPEGKTSSYLTVDSTSLVRMIKSSDVGDLIGDLNPVKLNENFIRLPSVRDGFTLELVESSRPDVVALDGSVVHLTEDVVVTLKLKITNLSDPSDVVYVTSSVKVLGKGQPEGEDKTDNTTQSNNNNGQDTVTEVFAGDGFDWDFGFSTHWNGGEKGETAPTEKVENSGAQLSWLMLIILISIIVLVLLLTFMILIIMKRKSRAEQQQLGREE